MRLLSPDVSCFWNAFVTCDMDAEGGGLSGVGFSDECTSFGPSASLSINPPAELCVR